MNLPPDLQRVFVFLTGPIRVHVTCDDTEPDPPMVTLAEEGHDWITLRVACGLQRISNPARATIDDAVTMIVDTTLQYLPSKPSDVQIEKFREVLTAWVGAHRRAAAASE